MERNGLVVLVILCFIVALYGVTTSQWGLVFSFIWFIVVISLVLAILQKTVKYFETAHDLNRKLAYDIESLKESVDGIKEDIRDIKDIMKKE